MTQMPPPPPPVSPYQPQTAQAVAEAPPSSMGGWSLALGIIGMLLCIPLGLVAIIMGIIALGKPAASKGKAIGGIVTGGLALLLSPMLIAVLLVGLSRARDFIQMAMCATNLKAVGAAVQGYRTDNDAYPPDLDVLIRQGRITQNHLECPGARDRKPWPHYFYLAPPPGAPGTTIIMCDLKDNHPRDGRKALTLSGSVKGFKTESEFQAALDQPANAAFAKALREAEGP